MRRGSNILLATAKTVYFCNKSISSIIVKGTLASVSFPSRSEALVFLKGPSLIIDIADFMQALNRGQSCLSTVVRMQLIVRVPRIQFEIQKSVPYPEI